MKAAVNCHREKAIIKDSTFLLLHSHDQRVSYDSSPKEIVMSIRSTDLHFSTSLKPADRRIEVEWIN